jgi:glycosyltransferase involved in cell wall biosynthesis
MTHGLRSLYVCYLSLDDPLVETQVVAYLAGLARRGHYIHLLTFEPRRLARAERQAIRERLRARGIRWHSLRYHKRPSLPATIYDVAATVIVGGILVLRHRLHALHARSHVPAAAGLLLRRLTGCLFIFDIRGLMAEEYVDAGRWRFQSLPYRITKRVERKAIAHADAVVVLTQRVRQYLFGDGDRGDVWVIPCCADTARLESQRRAREAVRTRLGVQAATVMVYVGKFTGWYMEAEMVDFFAYARRTLPDLHFLVLTQTDPEAILPYFGRAQGLDNSYTVTRCRAEVVGEYLAAADIGISFIRPTFSKISTSPTKLGEYLAAGLPTISSARVGDVDDIIDERGIGVLVRDFSADGYQAATEAIHRLRQDPRIGERCRAIAREQFSLEQVGVPRYDEVYTLLAGASEEDRHVARRAPHPAPHATGGGAYISHSSGDPS